jgi:hypothetical protein
METWILQFNRQFSVLQICCKINCGYVYADKTKLFPVIKQQHKQQMLSPLIEHDLPGVEVPDSGEV